MESKKKRRDRVILFDTIEGAGQTHLFNQGGFVQQHMFSARPLALTADTKITSSAPSIPREGGPGGTFYKNIGRPSIVR